MLNTHVRGYEIMRKNNIKTILPISSFPHDVISNI